MSTVRIQVRRGVAADWTSVNPILAAGEMGYETDTNKFKFGNGTGAWSTLAYGASDIPGVTEIAQDAINSALSVGTGLTKTYNDGANTITVAINDAVWATKAYVDSANTGLVSTADSTYIPFEDRGVANGVASLDSNTKVPTAQISDSSVRSRISASGNGITYNSTTGALSLDFSNAATSVASQGYVATQIANTVNGAPGALDTLLELSNALGADANFATTVTNNLATKAPIASPTFTGTVTIPAGAVISGYDLQANRETAVTAAIATAATDATSKANAAQSAAISAAATDATTKADAARSAAEATAATDATSKANGAVATAAADATTKANAAIATAATDATTKANAAQAAAEAAAATDATGKANGAVATAAADATSKANAAQAAAIAAAATAAGTALSAHESDTTNVHGISDTSLLATTANVATAKSEAITQAGSAADTKVSTAVAALTKSSVGLGNVDNTADASKPVSTAQATAIATAKSEAIADATSRVNAVIASAPAALDTLNELATALGNDASFATTMTNSLAAKAPLASPTFTGTVTVAAAGVAFTDGTQTKEGVPSRTTISQKTASYTLSALSERDAMIEMNAAGATTLTIPTDATLSFPIGTSLDVLRVGAGAVDIAGASGVTVNATPGLKLRAQWSSATLIKRAANTWVLVGDLSA